MRTTIKKAMLASMTVMTMGLLLLASNNFVEGAVSDDPEYTDMTSVLDAAGNPTVQIYYRLDLLDAADIDTDTTVNANAVSMKMTHEGSAWLGLGLANNEEGDMIGAEVMIGRPDGSAQGRSGQNPSLYGPISAKSPAGVIEMAEQDFVDSSIVIQGGVTTLTFTRALGKNGSNGLAFDIDAVQTFVWAAGPTPFPSYHASRGDFTIDWAAVARPVVAIAATNTNTGNALEGVMTTVTGTGTTATNNVWTDTEGASSIDVIAGGSGSEAGAETGAVITDNTSTAITGAEKETTNLDTEVTTTDITTDVTTVDTTDVTTDISTDSTSIVSTESSMQQTDANAANTDITTGTTITESSMQQTDANAANANTDVTTDITTDTTSTISTESSINTDTTTNADTSSYTNTNTDAATDTDTTTDTDTSSTASVPFSDPLELEPNLTVQYRVLNVPQDGTEPAANADPNAIEFLLTYVGSAWLALGTNPAGRSMADSEIVLGQPLEPNVAAVNPAKYRVGAGYSAAAVQPMEDAQQTLLSSSIVEENGSTVLQYTKLLKEDGEHTIDPSKVNSFVYAIGTSNSYPSIHQTGESQQFALDLSAAQSQPIVGVGGGGVSGTKVFIAHGIMAVIAWAFLAPMAAAFSSLRDLFPSGPMWFKMHMTFNIIATLLTVTTFLLAVIYGKASFNDKHFVTGWVIFFGVLGQATLGALRPATNPNAKDGFKGWWEQVIVGNKRAIWEAAHKLLGWSLLGVAMWQMYTGLQLLNNNYGTKDYTTAYWGWMVAFWVLVGLAEIVVYFKDETNVEHSEEKEYQVEQST